MSETPTSAAPETAPETPQVEAAPASEAPAQVVDSATSQGHEADAPPSPGGEDLDSRLSALLDEKLQAYGLKPQTEPEPELHPAEVALKQRTDADLESLSEDDRALVQAIAGDNLVQQARVYTQLLKAGKIGAAPAAAPETSATEPDKPAAEPPNRIDMNPPGTTTPDDWDGAAAAVARRVKDLRL